MVCGSMGSRRDCGTGQLIRMLGSMGGDQSRTPGMEGSACHYINEKRTLHISNIHGCCDVQPQTWMLIHILFMTSKKSHYRLAMLCNALMLFHQPLKIDRQVRTYRQAPAASLTCSTAPSHPATPCPRATPSSHHRQSTRGSACPRLHTWPPRSRCRRHQ